jgi:hypothetical protein
MLSRILKLFGLDVPAQVDAAKASIELQLSEATTQAKHIAGKAAIVLALYAVAIITGAMAAGVGLIALYRWTSQEWGTDAALGILGGLLVLVTLALGTIAAIRRKSLPAVEIVLPRVDFGRTGVISDFGGGASASGVDPAATDWPGYSYPGTRFASPGSASDLVKPLASFLSRVGKYPGAGNPIVDELIENLGGTADGTADEVIDGAANLVRHGERSQLIIILTGAAFVGWLLARHSQR